MDKEVLFNKSKEIRKNIIEMIYEAKSGHPGGALSCTDIITYLYFERMKVYVNEPHKDGRDRFVLSKGHAAPALYATLAEKGFFCKDELMKLRKIGALLQGHPDAKNIPGVDVSTGSLGQGISNAVGMALGLKLENKDSKVYVLLGDGELQEGLVWEAAMCAAHYKLDNLVAIVDYNGLQIDGKNEEVMSISPLDEKWKSFGWKVIKCDGHDYEELDKAFEEADKANNTPVVIIAKTIKGKGVSFMENQAGWHGQAPNLEQKEKAITEICG
ncbi:MULTISPECIES: transketolase [Clostridium]|uniref:Transketolase n=1 Tax=Clostridium cibarium TaxID=2762247 RepID=A0ABR8PRK4_9CLOT|nr:MULTISPECIES: transketolase [Clostridium]MBD7910806.1 transketolase [Clostridium cibarium]